jgi:hypothetical protein
LVIDTVVEIFMLADKLPANLAINPEDSLPVVISASGCSLGVLNALNGAIDYVVLGSYSIAGGVQFVPRVLVTAIRGCCWLQFGERTNKPSYNVPVFSSYKRTLSEV